MTDQECDFIRNYQNISFQIYIMKSYFIYDCIKDEILLEIIKIYHLNLYYEILLLSMTESGMKFYQKLLKYIIPNLYYEIPLLSMTGSRMELNEKLILVREDAAKNAMYINLESN